MGLPHRLQEKVRSLDLPETLDRLRGASSFIDHVSEKKADWENRAFIRASLSDFRSVDQALYWDLGRREVHSPEKSPNPLVHLVYRMRRIAVYVRNAKMAEHDTTVPVWLLDEEKNLDIRVLLIDEVERYLLLEKRLLRSYSAEDISRTCEWFEENQRVFGAPLVINVGIWMYCEELCDVYAGRRKDGVASSGTTR